MKLANNVNISQLSKVGNGVGAATTTTTMCKKVAGVVGTIVAFLHNITRSTKKYKRQKRNDRHSAPHIHTILEKTVDEKLPHDHHCHWMLMPTLLQVLLDVASGAAGDDGGGGELLVLATLARKHFNLIDIAT